MSSSYLYSESCTSERRKENSEALYSPKQALAEMTTVNTSSSAVCHSKQGTVFIFFCRKMQPVSTPP